jgi:uncharacterized RDD family membrane protein YckC
MTEQPGTHPPGWYQTGDGWERWFDGTSWTEHTRQAQAAYPPAAHGQGIQPHLAAHPPYAHWGKRVGATLVDGLLFVPFYVVAVVLLAAQGDSNDPAPVWIVLGVLAYVAGGVVTFWNTVWRQGSTGYSLGKQALGIRLVKEATLEAPGKGLTFGRQVAHVADSLSCYVGYLWPLWDEKRQTFADKICSTVVIEQQKG